MARDFTDKVVVVTGGSRGIGRSIALGFGQAGAKVAINYINNGAAAEETLKEMSALGIRGQAYKADVSNSSDVEKMFKQIQAAAYIVAAVPSCTIEYARYRKERAARIKQYKEHDAMIEASKAKLDALLSPIPLDTLPTVKEVIEAQREAQKRPHEAPVQELPVMPEPPPLWIGTRSSWRGYPPTSPFVPQTST